MRAKSLVLLLVLLVAGMALKAQSLESKHFMVNKLHDGVYAIIHKSGRHAISNASLFPTFRDCMMPPNQKVVTAKGSKLIAYIHSVPQ